MREECRVFRAKCAQFRSKLSSKTDIRSNPKGELIRDCFCCRNQPFGVCLILQIIAKHRSNIMKRHHLELFFVCIAAAASASCSEGTDNSTCTDGTYKCVINTLNKCVDGQWQNETTCSATQTCNETEGRCVPNSAEQPPTTDQCYPDGVRQCVGNTAVRECRNKKWKTIQTCNDDQTCNESTKSCDPKTNPNPGQDTCAERMQQWLFQMRKARRL